MDDKDEDAACKENSDKDEEASFRIASKKHDSTSSESEDIRCKPDTALEKTEMEEKDALICELKDRLLRLQADFQNSQKRQNKEMAEFRTYANAGLLGELLLVIDDFQNALTCVKKDEESELIRGFGMIFNKFMDILKKEGLSEISAESEAFDPWKHEAVERIPSDNHPENTVIDVVQKGYMFKDKIIRPAKVRVSAGNKNEIHEETSDDENDEEE